VADGDTGLPDRQVLRHWPWLVLCTVGGSIFGGLAALAGYAVLHTPSATVFVVAGVFAVGLGLLSGYTLASLRTRTVLDRRGATLVEAFRRRNLPWARVERLDVTHSLPGWAVRAWADNQPRVVYLCHDTHGRRPKPETYEKPPPEAPYSMHRGYELIERYWRAAAGRSPAHRGQ
jgi:hypothetical protein